MRRDQERLGDRVGGGVMVGLWCLERSENGK